jgi:uncharacterized membrane protein YphA (DoxX/SURF4 family)
MNTMNARSIGYWTTTVLTSLAFLSGGAAYLSRADFAVAGLAELGYPAYFVTILGAWKVLGGLALLLPRLPRLKEWAYAGIAFDLTGAAFSHAAFGHPAAKAIAPIVLLGIAAASWALRPASRRLGTATDEPATVRGVAVEHPREPLGAGQRVESTESREVDFLGR